MKNLEIYQFRRFVMTKKYGDKAQESVKEAMHKMKKGRLESGKSHKKVTDKRQAIAIGLSEARKKGAKVPKKTA
jgi:hypothetical protein